LYSVREAISQTFHFKLSGLFIIAFDKKSDAPTLSPIRSYVYAASM
jgi:hypothetical protein